MIFKFTKCLGILIFVCGLKVIVVRKSWDISVSVGEGVRGPGRTILEGVE